MNDPSNPCGCQDQPAAAGPTSDEILLGLNAALGGDVSTVLASIPPPPTEPDQPTQLSDLKMDSVIAGILAAHKGPKIILL